jgi:hypothetical protein
MYYKYELLIRSGEAQVRLLLLMCGRAEREGSVGQGNGLAAVSKGCLLLTGASSRVKAWWAQGITECLLIDCVAKLKLGWCHCHVT